jgi:hypothetical protein
MTKNANIICSNNMPDVFTQGAGAEAITVTRLPNGNWRAVAASGETEIVSECYAFWAWQWSLAHPA